MQVRFPSAARDSSPRVNFHGRLSYGVCTLPCAIACIYISAHVNEAVVHVRVRWIMETLKHPACTVGLVAQLWQLAFPGEGSRNFLRKKSLWDNAVVKKSKTSICWKRASPNFVEMYCNRHDEHGPWPHPCV